MTHYRERVCVRESVTDRNARILAEWERRGRKVGCEGSIAVAVGCDRVTVIRAINGGRVPRCEARRGMEGW